LADKKILRLEELRVRPLLTMANEDD